MRLVIFAAHQETDGFVAFRVASPGHSPRRFAWRRHRRRCQAERRIRIHSRARPRDHSRCRPKWNGRGGRGPLAKFGLSGAVIVRGRYPCRRSRLAHDGGHERVDDLANDAIGKVPNESWANHFRDVSQKIVPARKQQMEKELGRMWPKADDTPPADARQQVVRQIVDHLQVYPLSAPQFRFSLAKSPLCLIESPEQSGVPTMANGLARLAKDRCKTRAVRLREEGCKLSRIAIDFALRVLLAQLQAKDQEIHETVRLRGELKAFIQPLSEKFER